MAKKEKAAAASKAAQNMVEVNVLEHTNQIQLTGNVVSAECRTFESGKKVTTLKIAHNFGKGKDGKKRAIFPRVRFYGELSEELSKKGAAVLVSGFISQNNYAPVDKETGEQKDKVFGQVITAMTIEAAPMNGKRVASQNNFVLTGRLPKDAAYFGENNGVAKFTVMHNGKKEIDEKNGTLSLDVTAFSRHNKKDTPIPTELLTKGTAVKVSGYLAAKPVEGANYFDIAYNVLKIEATPITGTKMVPAREEAAA